MRIAALMHSPAVVCRRDDTLEDAARLLWEEDCGALPVVDDADCVVGIVTDRDLCMAAYTQGRALDAIPVERAMSRVVHTATPDDPVGLALQRMREHQVRRIPVVDYAGRPVGMLSINDLVRHAALSRRGSEVEHEVVDALAVISQPRAIRPSSAPALPATPRRPVASF